MTRKTAILIISWGVLLAGLGACKKTYFHVSEEANDGVTVRFKTAETYYLMGKSIALTEGSFRLTPCDSTVLFIEGEATNVAARGANFFQWKMSQTARFFVTLPPRLRAGRYDAGHHAVCEIVGSKNYQVGENLFVCQSGEVVIDSLKGNKVFGKISGRYLNTRNQSLTVDGPFKAQPK